MRSPILRPLLLISLALSTGLVGCQQNNTVEFTAILPLSGDAAIYGQSIQRGIELGIEQLASDSPGGFAVTLKVEDSESDATKAADLLRQAYTTSTAVIGGVTSDEALAMVEVADSQERILLSPSASSPELSGKSRYFFRIFPSSVAESAPLAAFVADRLLAREVVIVAQEDSFGEGAIKTFKESFGAKGEILGTIRFAVDDFDFRATVAEAMKILPPVVNEEKDVRAIYVAATGNALANALKALRAGGFDRGKDYLITSSALANPKVLEAAGDGAERCYFTQTPYDTASEKEPMKSFVEAYRAKYSEEPDIYAAHGYDTVSVFVRALEERGAALPSDFVKGMRAVQDHAGVTGTIQFRETGDVQKFMRVYFVSEGQPRDFEEFIKEWQAEMNRRMQEIQDKKNRLRARS